MTDQELDIKIDEALRRVELKVDIAYMMWLIKTTGVLPVDSTRPGDLLYSLPCIHDITPEKLLKEDIVWRLRQYQEKLMGYGMYVDIKVPVSIVGAL
jgi:hypothetical protein